MRKKEAQVNFNWKTRLGLFLGGVLIALYGWERLQRGVFGWQTNNGMAVLAPAVILAGLVIALLSLLPPASVVARWISRRKPRGQAK